MTVWDSIRPTRVRASACSACRNARHSSAPRFKSNRRPARARRFSSAWMPLPSRHMVRVVPDPARSLRIVLADDHVTVRHGLKLLIDSQPDMNVVSEASDGETAVHLAVTLKPDVI